MLNCNLEMNKYGISDARYLEMEAFCLQYLEWKQFLQNNMDSVISVMQNDEIPTVWDEERGQTKRQAGLAKFGQQGIGLEPPQQCLRNKCHGEARDSVRHQVGKD